jgi:hypothetical protein
MTSLVEGKREERRTKREEGRGKNEEEPLVFFFRE